MQEKTKQATPQDKKAVIDRNQDNEIVFDKPQIMTMSNIAKIISTYDLATVSAKKNKIDNDA